jgi:hypothetical protein
VSAWYTSLVTLHVGQVSVVYIEYVCATTSNMFWSLCERTLAGMNPPTLYPVTLMVYDIYIYIYIFFFYVYSVFIVPAGILRLP